MKYWAVFCAGIIIGCYMNSDIGAKHGYAAGKWTRELFKSAETGAINCPGGVGLTQEKE